MTINRKNVCTHPVTISLDRLSKGVDQILKRWSGPDRPDKNALLNDLAAAIRPGANWGALKMPAPTLRNEPETDNASHIPRPPKDAMVLPARLFQIENDRNDTSIYELAEDARPLFTLRHKGDPIIGLELSVHEGNGYCEVSIFTRFILSRDHAISVASVNAWEMEPEVAHLVFNAVQNLQNAAIYPTFAQADCGCLRMILGPCEVAAALPDIRYRGAKPNVPSQGVRVLFDENDAPSTADLDTCLRLVSVSLPHLKLETFSQTEPVQFRISQPRIDVWMPADFETPDILDERTLFRDTSGGDWMHDGNFLWEKRISGYGKLNEALDLALALIDIDDPNLYLHVLLTPEPKRKKSSQVKAGWRGGILTGWKILKLKRDVEPQALSLDAATQNRLEAGLNGWALCEGYSVQEGKPKVSVEALIARDVRRASHHMEQVRALMDGANPEDKEVLSSLET